MEISIVSVRILDNTQCTSPTVTDDGLVWMSPDATGGGDPLPRVKAGTFELQRRSRFLRDDVIEFSESSEAPQIIDAWLPLLRLHCPKQIGCKARELVTSSARAEVRLQLALPGIQIANGVEVTLATDSSWETSDGKCLEVVVPIRLRLTFGQYFLNGKAFAIGFNLQVEDIESKRHVQREIATSEDECIKITSIGQRRDLRSISALTRVQSGTNTVSIRAASVTSGEFNVGIPVLGAMIDLSVAYDRSSTYEHLREYTLVPGAEYEAFTTGTGVADAAAEILWRTVVR